MLAHAEKARNLIDQARGICIRNKTQPIQFMLTIDEADDFYRTDGGLANGQEERQIKMEEKLHELRQLGPLVQFEVTATLLAIYMTLMKIGQADKELNGDVFYVEASREYVDARMLVPPSDAVGNPEFITSESDLNNNNKYADAKVRALWKAAAEHRPPAGRCGALLLDATTAAVRAGGRTVGIYDKAGELMRLHPHAIAVIVSGAEIAWATATPLPDRPQDGRPLGQQPNIFRGKAKIFTNVLQDIDRYYPERPVFVFGYSQLVRGISYRSSRRVPSHFILLYKDGTSLCRLVQAAGRAMGEQASVLRANGFMDVKLLTQTQDFDAIRAYPEFLKTVGERMSSGMTLKAALEQQFAGKYNVFHGKTVGQKKLHLEDLQQTLKFAPSHPGELIGATAEDEMMGTQGRGLMRAILELLIVAVAYEEEEGKSVKEINEELSKGDWDQYFEQDSPHDAEELSLPRIRAALKVMCRPNGNRPEVVLRTNGPRFYLNAEGVDKLPGRQNPLFRDPSPEELAIIDDCCAICCEPMTDAAKELRPCGHYFHNKCLRSWLEQSRSCPVCRASLAHDPSGPSSATRRGQHGPVASAGVLTSSAGGGPSGVGAVPAGATTMGERAPTPLQPQRSRCRHVGSVVDQSAVPMAFDDEDGPAFSDGSTFSDGCASVDGESMPRVSGESMPRVEHEPTAEPLPIAAGGLQGRQGSSVAAAAATTSSAETTLFATTSPTLEVALDRTKKPPPRWTKKTDFGKFLGYTHPSYRTPNGKLRMHTLPQAWRVYDEQQQQREGAGPSFVEGPPTPPFNRSASFTLRLERELESAQQAAADELSYHQTSQEAASLLSNYPVEDVD